jgi:uncharacterized membrane protein YjgN (DUF898 family)
LITKADAMREHSNPADSSSTAMQAQLPPAANDSIPAPESHAFTFTGSGREYFRIWIVNLLFTVATLGIYSAWAKVRRLQYFDRNTQLAGAAFDFRGDPKAILKGRVLAVLLLASYHYAFGFSLAIGLTIVAILLLALPLFLRSALRFRLHNTQYRGLHFDFSGSAGGAYRAYLPPLLTFLLPGALVALDPSGNMAAPAFLLYFGWPLMHGAMKRYQQRHLQFGAAGSGYHVPARRFFKPYLVALLLVIGGAAALTGLLGVLMYFLGPDSRDHAGLSVTLITILSAVLASYIFYLLAGPYLQVRIANLVWSNTTFPGVAIGCTMSASGLVRLQTRNAVLTILTLGLYRPFAVVSVYRYRLANLALSSAASFEQVVAGAARRHGGAAGDGMADFLGVDLSW